MMPPADYLPQGNRNLVFGLIVPPPGYNIEQVNTMADRIEETVRPYWEAGERADPKAAALAASQLAAVPTFDWATMSPGEPVVPPVLENYFLVSFDNILFHGGISADPKRVVDVKALFGHATRADVLPGVFAFAFQVPLFQLGGATGSAIKLQLAGPDLDEIVRCAVGVMGRLFAEQAVFGQVLPEPGNFAIPTPELQVRPDLVRLSELGLTTRDVGLAVQAAGDGAIIDEYRIGGESIDLKIVATDAAGRRRDVHIEDVAIATPWGEVVTLGSIAEIQPVGAPQAIARVGRQRAVSFQVTPAEGVPLEQAMQRLEALISESRQAGQIPPSIITSMAGSASKLQAVRAVLLGDGTFLGTVNSSMVLALFVVYLVMCVLFQSFTRPLVIMLTVPLATLGGFMALAAVRLWSLSDRYMPDQSMDVLTMLGFVLLIGVVVNNAILIVHQTGNFMTFGSEFGGDGSEPMPPRKAIAEAVRTRIRPIFMTTLTSVLGMAPLVLMPGSGSELYRGLGSVVCGGLLVSTIFTIVLTPMLLSLVIGFQQRRRAPSEQRETPPRRHPHQPPPAPRPAAGVPASAARSSDS
jgi:HAE1 family hydrophobic/amphiphilic exporter-1